MINNDLSMLRDRSGLRLSATSFVRHPHFVGRRERNVSPHYVPSTGAVRPQAGNAAIAAMTPDVAQGKARSRVRSWSPPV